MICLRPPLMYWPRRENIQSTANVQNDGHKNFGKKNFREHFQKKNFFKDGKRKKKEKQPKQKNSGIIHSIA